METPADPVDEIAMVLDQKFAQQRQDFTTSIAQQLQSIQQSVESNTEEIVSLKATQDSRQRHIDALQAQIKSRGP
eukprot:3153762-Pyramimonas_sp.AAC.1